LLSTNFRSKKEDNGNLLLLSYPCLKNHLLSQSLENSVILYQYMRSNFVFAVPTQIISICGCTNLKTNTWYILASLNCNNVGFVSD